MPSWRKRHGAACKLPVYESAAGMNNQQPLFVELSVTGSLRYNKAIMNKLVLLRHGESTWNRENRFTGWTDVPLSLEGEMQAHRAGRLLKDAKFSFDLAFTSVLKRAIDTLDIVLGEMETRIIPRRKSWRLNERHYGSLQGLNKQDTAKREGAERVRMWRRGYLVRPPAVGRDDDRYPGNDPKYAHLRTNDIPFAESLKDTIDRFFPFWEGEVVPEIKNGKRVVIVGHGSTFRALIKILDGISDFDVENVNVPYCIPLVYEFDDRMVPVGSYYLGDKRETEEATELVRRQAEVA